MIKVNRSIAGRLGLLVLGFALFSQLGSVALAADEADGNPGRFIENIRKGLSGISRFFWSPKGMSAEPRPAAEAAGKKLVQQEKSVSTAVQAGTPQDSGAKQSKSVVKAKVTAATMVQSHSVTPKERESAKADIKAKPSLMPKPHKPTKNPKAEKAAQPVSGEKKRAKQAPSGASMKKKALAKVDKGQKALKALPQAKKTAAKTAGIMAHSQAKALKRKIENAKPVLKKAVQTKSGIKTGAVKKVQKIKTPQAQRKIAVPPEGKSRLVKTEKRKDMPKGTYIWLPGKGSPLFARYGRAGIPASRLLASGDIERTDGRWVFAPYKAGLLPGIYGLSEQINKVGDEETWVGRGRAWVYVFGKKRTYSSFFATEKKHGKKVAQAVATGNRAKKSAALKKAGAAQQRSGMGKSSRLSRKLASVAPTGRQGQQGQMSSDKPSPQDGVLAKKGSGKTVRNGNWEKKNGRWVYRGKGTAAQDLSTKPARTHGRKNPGRSRDQVRRNSKGGWVYRNNRWIYMANSQPKQQKSMTASKGRGALASRQNGKKDQMRIRQEKTEKPEGRGAVLSSQAEGNQPRGKVMRNQKSWVRRDNRWVYANAIPSKRDAAKGKGQAQESSKAGKRHFGQGRLSGEKNPLPLRRKATRQALGAKGGAKKRGQEFLFFIPGPTPGSGGWFAAPVELLRYARKVGKPEYRPQK